MFMVATGNLYLIGVSALIFYFQMCSNTWPLLLDLSRDECKRILRRLELDAYASMVSAFRAQGDLSKDKKKILVELQSFLRFVAKITRLLYCLK